MTRRPCLVGTLMVAATLLVVWAGSSRADTKTACHAFRTRVLPADFR